MDEGKWVVVTSSHRDVWFGYCPAPLDLIQQRFGVLENCRHVWKWNPNGDAKGLGCLAVAGPGPGSKIGPAVDMVLVADVVSVWFVHPEALETWRQAGW